MKKIVFIIIIFLIGCDAPVDRSELAGTYTSTYYNLTDTLIISTDGSYIHKYVGTDGKIVKEGGHWKFESFDREVLGITFEDFVFRTKTGGVGTRGYWHTGMQKYKTVKLCFEHDQGWNKCFSKID